MLLLTKPCEAHTACAPRSHLDSIGPRVLEMRVDAQVLYAMGDIPILGQLDDARNKGSMKSSRPPKVNALLAYGESGRRLIQDLREWLETAPEGELSLLRLRIRAFVVNF